MPRPEGDDNPYASPECEDGAASLRTLPVIGAWRDGDVLLVQRRGGVLSRACIKSNRLSWIIKTDLTTLSKQWAIMVFPVSALPFVGLLLSVVVQQFLVWTGRAGMVYPWFTWWRWAMAVSSVLLVIAGNLVSGVGLFIGSVGMCCAGMAFSALSMGANLLVSRHWLSDRLVEPDLVAIRGAHPEYLNRFPTFKDRTASG